jgi:ankyrin repeat protein
LIDHTLVPNADIEALFVRAVLADDAISADILLDINADPNAALFEGYGSLDYAIAEGLSEELLLVLERHGAIAKVYIDPRRISLLEAYTSGATPFINAAMLGTSPDVLALLAEYGADPFARDNRGISAWEYIQSNPSYSEATVDWYLRDLGQ